MENLLNEAVLGRNGKYLKNKKKITLCILSRRAKRANYVYTSHCWASKNQKMKLSINTILNGRLTVTIIDEVMLNTYLLTDLSQSKDLVN